MKHFTPGASAKLITLSDVTCGDFAEGRHDGGFVMETRGRRVYFISQYLLYGNPRKVSSKTRNTFKR